LLRQRRGEGDQDRVRVPDLVVVVRRPDQPALDERLQGVSRHVLDVALAAVDPVDDVALDVDEEDALAGLGEHLGQREPDVPGSDDRDVGHDALTLASRAAATRSDACPSPYSGGRSAGIRAFRTASTRASGSSSTSTFAPSSTVSTHSVDGRAVTHGTPYQYASFCSPPESVTITRACDASAAKSRYPSGSIVGSSSPSRASAARVRGCAGNTSGSSIRRSPSTSRRSRSGCVTFASRW